MEDVSTIILKADNGASLNEDEDEKKNGGGYERPAYYVYRWDFIA